MSADLIDRVRSRLVGEGSAVTSATVAAAVREEAGGLIGDTEMLAALRLVQSEFLGAGALEPLLRDDRVTDVLVSGPQDVWIDRGAGLERADVSFPGEDAVRRLAQRLALATGRRLDDAQPWVDGWLDRPGAAAVRVHAVLAPIAAAGTCLSLRVLRPATHTLSTLERLGMFPPQVTAVLRRIVQSRLAFLVSGGTGAGKTTVLAAMLGEVAGSERITCVEEAAELHPGHPHVVRLVTRPPNIEGTGEIGVRELVRQALRMRPDRLVVGEVRGAEVCELLAALNTGHAGGAGTVHANAAHEVPARLEALAALGGLDRGGLHSQLSAAVQVILHVRRDPRRGRVLGGVGVLDRDGQWVRVVTAWDAEQGWGPGRDRLDALLAGRDASC